MFGQIQIVLMSVVASLQLNSSACMDVVGWAHVHPYRVKIRVRGWAYVQGTARRSKGIDLTLASSSLC